MKLISVLPKASEATLKTFKSKSGRISHILQDGSNLKIISCDANGAPYLALDLNKFRKDVYMKASDGATLLKQKGKKIKELPTLLFNTVAEMLLK